ncbi:MAG: adenylate/guanylate cyclase domain-containing protein [Spirochaetes bacterium]|nr:adenylate/guanylate cyclase domain-containing protein [Spirochaetota bacterium]
MKIRWQAILVGFATSVIVYLVSLSPVFLKGFEKAFYNFRFWFRDDASNPARYHESPYTSKTAQRVTEVRGSEVVSEERWNQYKAMVVMIDDQTLDTFGEWPFPRDVHAQFLRSVRSANPKAVLFDILFIVPQKIPASLLAATKDNPALGSQLERIYGEMDNTLTREMERSGNVIIDLSLLQMEQKGQDAEIVSRKRELWKILERHFIPINEYNKRMIREEFEGFQPLLIPYARAAKGSGAINFREDVEDRVVRRFQLVYPMKNGKFILGNIMLMLLDQYGATKNDVSVKMGEYVKIKTPTETKVIPIDDHGNVLINYAGRETIFFVDNNGKRDKAHAIRSVSYRDVVQQKPDVMAELQGKMLFVGAFSQGMSKDVFQTPFGTMFGISILANTFNTVLTDKYITTSPRLIDTLMIFIMGIILSIALSYTRIWVGAIIAVFTFIGTATASTVIFITHDYALTTVPALLTALLTFISITVYRALTEEKDKQFLKQTFSSYLAPELIDIMYESKQMPKLGGESRVNTAFFTDIQGFSTFSEKLTPTQVVELLNEYLGSMTDILLAERGTLDKYIGDAIIGIFGAPMMLPDHAMRACKVAIGMQTNLGRLREKWAAEKADPSEPNRNSKNLPPEEWEPGAKWPRIVWDMRVRVGINSGEMVTGNMGSSMRMNYTMMGDTVNLAARLEAGAKQFGVYTLVAEETLNMSWQDETGTHVVKDMVESRFIDRITVVGKTAPVEVYEVIALKGELTPEQKELFTLFAEGVKYYQDTEWDKALAIFNKTKDIELYPKNKFTPSKMYIERCEEFKQNPPVKPGEKWDGVFRMTQKH